MPRTERLTLAAAATLSFVLRAIAFSRYRIDSDEPQHLHVAWGWTAGLVQYRDLFDNHMPLFHLLTAPLLAVLGERPDILLYMRAAMLPLFAVVLFLTWKVAAQLYSRRIALWTVVLLSLAPPFFLKSLEYRNDNLWTAVWMAALAVALAAPLTPLRSFVTGLLLGVALAVSIKTVGLAIALAGAALLTRRISTRAFAAAAAGFAVVPAAMAGWFAANGAWDAFVYCNFEFNSALTEVRPGGWLAWLIFPAGAIVVMLVARRFAHNGSLRAFSAITAALFVVAVTSIQVLVSPRDLLPIMPLLTMFVAAWIDRTALLAALAIVFAGSLFYYADRFENRSDEHITMMNQVLGVTRPGEPLMDIKGETIFRRRPYYFAFESITRTLMQHNVIRDTVPEDMIRARCYVSQAEGPMYPQRANRFVHEYFVDLGRLRAAGQLIADDGSFRIAVPGPYVVINDRGEAAGALDGSPYRGARELEAGTHRFERAIPGEQLVALWARAFERGYSPFHLRDREF